MSTRSALLLVATVAAAQACAPAEKAQVRAVAAAPLAAPVARPPATPPGYAYWEALDAGVTVKAYAPDLPLHEAQLSLDAGAAVRWSALPSPVRAAILEHGIAVVPRASPSARIGEAYAALRDARVPYVVTLDALFWASHVARERALAAVEDRVLAPAFEAMLRRLEIRLADEARAAPGDLTSAYAMARAVVAVGRALLSPSYAPPEELARAVGEEKRRIAAHLGPERSVVLGVTVDYSAIVPRGAAGESEARSAYARAMAWVASAPFVLAGRGEATGAEALVGAARTATRAALLVARALAFEGDAEAAYAAHRLIGVAEFVGGAGDDLTPRELAAAAVAVGIDVRDAHALTDTAKIDRLRHVLLAQRPSRLDDGCALHGAQAPDAGAPPANYARAATSARLLPSRSTPDADALQSLVFPQVGKLDPRADPPPASARDGIRAWPRALDVAAWLGALDARAILHEGGDDAYEGYDAALQRLAQRRPPEQDRHGSVYASSLDAIATFLAPSAADPVQPGASASAWRKRKIEASLAAWTTLRHDALAFARFPLASATLPAEPLARAAADVPAFVEPHPEAIAKLVSLVRQTSRGLRALGAMPADRTPLPLVEDVEHLLEDALSIARAEASDAPLSPEDRDALATIPARLHALERALAPSHADEASLAVDVHVDSVTRRALVEACGDLDDLYTVMREPGTGRLVLAVGAASSHYELTVPADERPTDAAWRARLHGAPAPARDDYSAAYCVLAPAPLDASGIADAAAP